MVRNLVEFDPLGDGGAAGIVVRNMLVRDMRARNILGTRRGEVVAGSRRDALGDNRAAEVWRRDRVLYKTTAGCEVHCRSEVSVSRAVAMLR